MHYLHSKIVKEIQELEKGILVNGKMFRFTVHLYLGDNLEIHQVSGLQTWFQHGYICRSCIITHKDLQENVDIKAYRTEEMYNRIMQKFQDDDLD